MDDAAIANALDELADRLEVLGENPFKLRAYRRAASTVRELDRPLATYASDGTLGDLDGFGDAIVNKVQQALREGRIDALERARAELPMDVGVLGRLPGLGPKRLRALKDADITDLDGLEQAARRGRLAALPGFGRSFEQRIVQLVPELRLAMERRRLDEALDIAQRLAVHCPGAMVVGATRRFEPLIERLRMLVPADAAQATRAIEALGGRVERNEDQRVAGRVDRFPVDLHLGDPSVEGRRVVQLTGPEQHVKNLKAWGAAHSISWKRIEGTEADLYATLGLQFIPPEMRTATEELEMATMGGLAAVVVREQCIGDLQCHTTWSDGADDMRTMAEVARGLGHQYLGFTDHSGALPIANAMDTPRLEEYVNEVRTLNDELEGITLLAGTEVEVDRYGALTMPDEALEQLDYVGAGIHGSRDLPPEAQTARYRQAIEHPLVRIVFHPTGRKVNERPPVRLDLDAVIAAAVEHDVALETNASPLRMDLHADQLRRHLGAGGLITINTDAHQAADLARLDYGVMTARKALATPARVINTWAIDDLRAWLRDR